MKLGVVPLMVLCWASWAWSAGERPNVVMILSDDYGWGSVGCYGGAGLKTPHLDRLAAEGRRFTNAYAPGSVCSPTRYGLMTGRYYWRTSVKDGEVLSTGDALHIETDRTTLASACKKAGHATAVFGKWHLGIGRGEFKQRGSDWNAKLAPGPLAIGFDRFFGMASNPWSGPHQFIENERLLEVIPGEKAMIDGNKTGSQTSGLMSQYAEDQIMTRITAEAVRFVDEHKDKPFFLYFAPNAIHRPVAPHPNFKGSKFGIYGDFIEELDASVGQLLAALDRHQLTQKTLVVFSSDNGGVVNRGNEEAAFALDQGLKINGHLRGGKHDIWEGGFREPFLVRWPGHTPAGTVSSQVVGMTDLLATFASILGTPVPAGSHAEDSMDVSRAFTETTPGAPVRDHVIMQSADGIYAIRMGDWKLIEYVDAPKFDHRNRNKEAAAAKKAKLRPKTDELYNLADDPAETKSVHASHPEIVTKLQQRLRQVRDAGRTRPDGG